MLSGMEPRHRLGFRLLTKLRPCDASVPCDLIPETTPLRLCVCARVGCAVLLEVHGIVTVLKLEVLGEVH